MSFMLTPAQMRARTKTVTRRLGWRDLKPGTRLLAVERCQGIKPGQAVEIFGEIEVTAVARMHLWNISTDDLEREGFPHLTSDAFVRMFCEHMGGKPDQIVTRIEFRHIGGAHGGR